MIANTEKDILERYEKKENGCWEWKGYKSEKGYGIVGYGMKKFRVHRLVYELIKGKIPKGKCVCHSCDNRICINPAHLWLGTNNENVQDRTIKGRSAIGAGNGKTKLTERSVLEIKTYAMEKGALGNKSGNQWGRNELAKKYSVNVGTITNIIMGHTWKHLIPREG